MATRSVSSFLAAAVWIGVVIAVGVMVVIAADAVFDIFGVIAVAPTDPTDTFDFFLTDLPNSIILFFFFFVSNVNDDDEWHARVGEKKEKENLD